VPRTADHDERRALISRSFAERLTENGLTATTFARVAAGAGISVGLIQHYFSSKEELLQFAYADCLQQRDLRIAQVITDGEAAGLTIRAILGSATRELLPLDEPRLRELHVTQNLIAQGLHDPRLAEIAASADRDLQLRTAIAVRNGKECGEVAKTVDDAASAARVLATAYGLATQLAIRAPHPRPSADSLTAAVLDPVLASIFTGRCRRHSP